MSNWPSAKSKKVLKALLKIGWSIKREARGSHKILERDGWDDYVYAFHEGVDPNVSNAFKRAGFICLKNNELGISV